MGTGKVGNDENISDAGPGEKLSCVVGFGALRESGGWLLGFRIGGERGRGVSVRSECLLRGDMIVGGGESGHVLFRGVIGCERSGFGRANSNIVVGDNDDGGGDGVEATDRKVGPGSRERVDTVSCVSGSICSNGFENDLAGMRQGSGWTKGVDGSST